MQEVFGVKKTTLDDQCQKYRWVARAAAWDGELDRRVREVEISELRKMQAQQIKVGEGLLLVGARELQQLQFKQKRADEVALAGGFIREPLLPAREIVRLIDAGAKIVRLNHDQPTNIEGPSRIELTGQGGAALFAELTTKELIQRTKAALVELAEEEE
jgi:hypothetical protein